MADGIGVHAHAQTTLPQGIEGVLDQLSLETDLSADTDGEPSELAEVRSIPMQVMRCCRNEHQKRC